MGWAKLKEPTPVGARLRGRTPTPAHLPLAQARLRLLKRQPAVEPDPVAKRGPGSRTLRQRQADYLACLRDTGNITLSCAQAGLSRRVAYHWREADARFAAKERAAFEDARDLLRLRVHRRAFAGNDLFLVAMAKVYLPEYQKASRQEHAVVDALPVKFTLAIGSSPTEEA